MEIGMAVYINTLRRIKSYIRNYKKIVRDDWSGYDVYPYYKYGRNLMGYCSMLYKTELTVFRDFNQERRQMALCPYHRMIIGTKLCPVINLSTSGIIICHEFGSKTHPLIPLNEYIEYLSRGLDNGTIYPGSRVSLPDAKNKPGTLGYTCAARVDTVCTEDLAYPILLKSYNHENIDGFNKPLDMDTAFKFMKDIAEFIDLNCPERRRKYHDRKTDKPHKPATE